MLNIMNVTLEAVPIIEICCSERSHLVYNVRVLVLLMMHMMNSSVPQVVLTNEYEASSYVDLIGFQSHCFSGKATSSFDRPHMYREPPTCNGLALQKLNCNLVVYNSKYLFSQNPRYEW